MKNKEQLWRDLDPLFWSKVKIGLPDECWMWTAGQWKGYGRVKRNHKQNCASRFAFQLAFPDKDITGLMVCHKCDTPLCCNPAHLFVGTALDNIRDQMAKGRLAEGEANPRAKLTVEAVRKIRDAYTCLGARSVDLAMQYGVNTGTIFCVVNRTRWKSVI